METAGRVLLVAALILAILGVGAVALSKLGVDRLPATLTWRSDHVTVFVPIGLMVVASIIGTILLTSFSGAKGSAMMRERRSCPLTQAVR